jgi:hypothetical protein
MSDQSLTDTAAADGAGAPGLSPTRWELLLADGETSRYEATEWTFSGSTAGVQFSRGDGTRQSFYPFANIVRMITHNA